MRWGTYSGEFTARQRKKKEIDQISNEEEMRTRECEERTSWRKESLL